MSKKKKKRQQNKTHNYKGILFVNQYKKEDKHPDYTGDATIDNKTYQIAAWWHYRQNKPPFLVIKFNDDAPLPPVNVPNPEDIDDDLPF